MMKTQKNRIWYDFYTKRYQFKKGMKYIRKYKEAYIFVETKKESWEKKCDFNG